ncbi:S28 family serine protease [Myroides sp. LJL119]
MKKSITTFLFLLFSVLVLAHPDQKQVEKALYNLKNVTFTLLDSPDDSMLRYQLKVRQPIDHNDESKGYFDQSVYYIHRGFDRPTVMETNGYTLSHGQTELPKYFDTNYLSVEHRFFGDSTPNDTPYQYLTLEQATGDLHQVNQLFKELYKGKWISTGISKGGQTTIFYKYFYPDDVDVAVPYVAPFNKSLQDPRIYEFLDQVGTKACRTQIQKVQTALFQNKKQILEKLFWYAKGAKLQFNYIGSLDKAFDLAVLEYDFAFWQGGNNCDELPNTKDVDALTQNLLKISNIDFFSDATIKKFASHYYQAGTQMGYYGYDITPFKKYVSFSENPSAIYMPEGTSTESFDDSLLIKVQNWLDNDANDILYVYGDIDTWSATRVTPSKKVNSKSFMVDNADHYKARVANMNPAMQKEFFEAFKNFTGLEPIKELKN